MVVVLWQNAILAWTKCELIYSSAFIWWSCWLVISKDLMLEFCETLFEQVPCCILFVRARLRTGKSFKQIPAHAIRYPASSKPACSLQPCVATARWRNMNVAVPFDSLNMNVAVPFDSLNMNVAVPFDSLNMNVAVPFDSLNMNFAVPFDSEHERCSSLWLSEHERCSSLWLSEHERCSSLWLSEHERCSSLWLWTWTLQFPLTLWTWTLQFPLTLNMNVAVPFDSLNLRRVVYNIIIIIIHVKMGTRFRTCASWVLLLQPLFSC